MSPLELPSTVDGWLRFVEDRCEGQLDVVHRTAELLRGDPTDAETTLARWNALSVALLNASTAAGLVGQTHPEESVRRRADAAEQAVSAEASALRLDPALYAVLAAVDATGLDATTQRMLAMTLRDFRRAGVDREKSVRARLHALAERETTQAQAFERNINDDVRTVTLRPEQLAGLPQDYVEAHPAGDDGLVTITTNYPDVLPLRAFARDASARRALLHAFDNRAWPVNDAILGELLEVRAERARLLGYASAPDYDAEIKMIGSGGAIADFIERLDAAVRPAAERDVAVLRDRQLQDLPDSEALTWADLAFYTEVVRRETYGVDAQEVRGYFEMAAVREGLLAVTGRLFGLDYTRVDVAAWDEEVATYDVHLDGELLGRIHLDLHPRAGKFSHAAHFPLVKGIAGTQLPQSALVCNLPRGLVSHDDVVTLFHEFGHLVHAVVGGRQDWARFSGVATERDFIEAPSQMLEEWAWDATVLATFARDASGAPISANLVEKMRAAERFGRGSDIAVQVAYTALSLGIHRDVPADITAYEEAVTARYLPFAALPETHKHTSFGHLGDPGYASAYYTYLWSLVISKDLFSGFDPDDLLAGSASRRYRDLVLAPGGSRPAAELVEAFLGRPTSTAAFDAWLAEG